ncbi:hypothetical protein LCGC14_0145000 [marine sediment metagenome]|uniref:Uncharacterized protein n=1 Tax=marine sediment metagenome TaxID=412755 RepID=A0A0F9Y189_9ZZZZ
MSKKNNKQKQSALPTRKTIVGNQQLMDQTLNNVIQTLQAMQGEHARALQAINRHDASFLILLKMMQNLVAALEEHGIGDLPDPSLEGVVKQSTWLAVCNSFAVFCYRIGVWYKQKEAEELQAQEEAVKQEQSEESPATSDES